MGVSRPGSDWNSFLGCLASDWNLQHTLNWPVEEDSSPTFLENFQVLFWFYTTSNPCFLIWKASLYNLEWIRLTNLAWIFAFIQDLIWFSSFMICSYFDPNHAFLVPIAIDSKWSCLLSISWLLNCQKNKSNHIFINFHLLFDLIHFLIDKKSK